VKQVETGLNLVGLGRKKSRGEVAPPKKTNVGPEKDERRKRPPKKSRDYRKMTVDENFSSKGHWGAVGRKWATGNTGNLIKETTGGCRCARLSPVNSSKLVRNSRWVVTHSLGGHGNQKNCP